MARNSTPRRAGRPCFLESGAKRPRGSLLRRSARCASTVPRGFLLARGFLLRKFASSLRRREGHGLGSSMSGFVHAELASARQCDFGQASPSLILDRTTRDASTVHVLDERVDVVAHEIEL